MALPVKHPSCILDGLNDLESYLQSKDVSGLITLSEEIENQLKFEERRHVIR
jgi:hypothetical protein